MAILTKVDEACPVTQKNLMDVYRSQHLKKKVSCGPLIVLTVEPSESGLCFLWNTQMEDFSAATGIPMNCIFPVKNYSQEIDLDEDVSTLILSALRFMVQYGDDFIERI